MGWRVSLHLLNTKKSRGPAVFNCGWVLLDLAGLYILGEIDLLYCVSVFRGGGLFVRPAVILKIVSFTFLWRGEPRWPPLHFCNLFYNFFRLIIMQEITVKILHCSHGI